MTLIEGIAERIGAITYAGLPAEAVKWTKLAVLDTVGVMLAGAREDCAQIVERVDVAGDGEGDRAHASAVHRIARQERG